jgi:hypothetical protein
MNNAVLGDNVEALVYVGASSPDEGERVGQLTTPLPGSSWRSSERENLR